MKDKFDRQIFLLLQIATVAVFLGRAWQHLYWDAPYRSLLWDEDLMKGIVNALWGMPWDEYITSAEVDQWIQRCIRATGWFYLFCALVAGLASRVHHHVLKLLPVGACFLILLAGLYTKEKFYVIGQFLEYSLQFSTPILFYLLIKQKQPGLRWIWAIRVLTALTFTCHGLYALNIYPRPGLFVEMTISILGVGEESAIYFLNIAGILDFIVSAAILVLPQRWLKPALIYIIFWGFATSIARVWAHFHFAYVDESLLQWLHEMVFRFPHFLLPLVVYVYFEKGSLDLQNKD